MNELNMIRVDLGKGSLIWVCILFFMGMPYVFTVKSDKKLVVLRSILGFSKKLPECSTMPLEKFKDYYPTHPILSTVFDWEQMGIPIKTVTPEFS